MSEALSDPVIQAVGWALVHFLWQGILVAAGLAAGLALMKNRSASARYALGVATLVVLVALPVVTAFRSYEPASPIAQSTPSPALPRFAGEGAPSPTPAVGEVATSFRETVRPWMPSLLVVWLAGVALLSVWHLGGWMQVRRLTRRATRPVDESWELALIRLRRRLGIEHAVTLLESAAAPVPSVIGWLRPVILVPASAFAGLTPEQLEAILAHELAHVRRHDYLINLLQAVVETLLFYHPAVWWVSRQVRQERESCCDDLAVAVCGDRLSYARALAALEGLRTPRLALGADGGSLLRRIRRLAGVPETAGGAPVAWVAGALALALLLAGAVFHDGARAGLPFEIRLMAEPVAKLAQAAAPAARDSSKGQWTAERTEDGINLQMTYRHDGKGRSNHGKTYDPSELVGLTTGSDVRFQMPRAAGTFHFQGRFDGELGEGTFIFQGNPGYIQEMGRIGYKVEQDDLFKLALFDVSPAYVSELKSVGYDDLSLDELVEFRIFAVTPGYIREMAELGYRDLPAKKLVEFHIHGVNPDEVRELAKVGLSDLSADRLVEFRIHGVKPELVRAMVDAGYENLSAEKLVELKIHGATPEFAREMAELGYRDVPIERLIEFRVHGVTPEFIREIGETGHEGVAADELVAMRIHGVDADFIRKAEARAGRKLSIDEILDKKILGWRE